MDRYTEKTKCCFKYDIKGFAHKIKEFNDYDAFYAYSIAVMKLGEYEDTDLTPEQVASLKAENALLQKRLDKAVEDIQDICKHCGFDNNPCEINACFAYKYRGLNEEVQK